MQTIEKKISPTSAYRIAAYSAGAMILFFIFMKLVGLVTIVEFRFLNFIIMFFGVRYMLLESRKANQGKLEYLTGMLSGFMTALYTSLFFAVFVFIYLSIDHGFMEYLKATQPFGSYLTPASASLITVIEGIAGGSIIAFAMMHLYNRDGDQG